MTYWARLWRVEVCAVAVLLASAVLMSVYVANSGSPEEDSILSRDQGAIITFVVTLIYGVVPVALFGAPMYTALSQAGKAFWWSAAGIGLLPGFVALLVVLSGVFQGFQDLLFAWLFFFWGLIVSVATHMLAKLTIGKNAAP